MKRALVLRPRSFDSTVPEGSTGIVDPIAPPHLASSAVCGGGPCVDLQLEDLEITNSAADQAFPRHQAHLHLGDVEPAGVLWGVVRCEAAPKAPSLCFSERGNQTTL